MRGKKRRVKKDEKIERKRGRRGRERREVRREGKSKKECKHMLKRVGGGFLEVDKETLQLRPFLYP
jgi:hypothetical protein